MKWNIDQLENVFEKMEKAGWNTKVPLKWGFFFFNKEKASLVDVLSELEGFNYQLENLSFRKDINKWCLNVTKTEQLTTEKLHKRNLAFEELADYCNASYDGWDVEQIIKN